MPQKVFDMSGKILSSNEKSYQKWLTIFFLTEISRMN